MLAVTPEVNSRKSLSIPSLKITPFSGINERRKKPVFFTRALLANP